MVGVDLTGQSGRSDSTAGWSVCFSMDFTMIKASKAESLRPFLVKDLQILVEAGSLSRCGRSLEGVDFFFSLG